MESAAGCASLMAQGEDAILAFVKRHQLWLAAQIQDLLRKRLAHTEAGPVDAFDVNYLLCQTALSLLFLTAAQDGHPPVRYAALLHATIDGMAPLFQALYAVSPDPVSRTGPALAHAPEET